MGKKNKESSCENCNNRKSCTLYNVLSREETVYLDNNKKTLFFSQGETVIKQGIFASNILYLKDGLLKQSVEHENGKQIIIKIIQPNQFLGIPIIESEQLYPYSVISLKQSSICVFKREAINNLISANLNLCHKILHENKQDHVIIQNKLFSIATKNTRGRVADVLLYLSENKLITEEKLKFIPKKDIGAMAGISWETTMKIFAELKHDRIISINNKCIFINDQQMLERLSQTG